MNAVEILIAARRLIEKPEAWTRAAPARRRDGRPVSTLSPHAVRFSAFGALTVPLASERQFLRANSFLCRACHDLVIVWNDDPDRTHAEVLVAFDRAIELARLGEEG